VKEEEKRDRLQVQRQEEGRDRCRGSKIERKVQREGTDYRYRLQVQREGTDYRYRGKKGETERKSERTIATKANL
jgi:uncharacterized protein YheU (UPF0270 family)